MIISEVSDVEPTPVSPQTSEPTTGSDGVTVKSASEGVVEQLDQENCYVLGYN